MTVSGGKIVLLDRDGVLNVDLPQGVRAMSELVIEPSAPAGVAALTKAGYTVLVITNQGAIGRGEVSRDEVDRINVAIQEAMAAADGYIAQFYVCPHSAEDDCDCRKPKPGLILQAQADWEFDVAHTWFIGDASRDVAAAQASGVQPALVRTGKGSREALAFPQVPIFDNIAAFAQFLIAQDMQS